MWGVGVSKIIIKTFLIFTIFLNIGCSHNSKNKCPDINIKLKLPCDAKVGIPLEQYVEEMGK